MTKAANLPPLAALTACPHCGHDEFTVLYRYSGAGGYSRNFDRAAPAADNSGMYDRVSGKPGKIAYCSNCQAPIARYEGERE